MEASSPVGMSSLYKTDFDFAKILWKNMVFKGLPVVIDEVI